MTTTTERPSVLFLSDPRAHEVELCGGKAATLAALTTDGCPVPEGFVVTTAAFEPGNSLRDAGRGELRAALARLTGRVAVRSSGVAEDLASASFAGQYEPILDVEGPDAVEAAVARCAASADAARVVFSVDELDRLEAGEILVAPVTTPAWTLAFGRAAAIVTDTGSVASHASIVAREHGIPAVVGAAHATRRIADGQRITVDGGRGVVRLAGGG
jgi:phosphoenolpyruvate synthase/pyruvate phosphate dikinase